MRAWIERLERESRGEIIEIPQRDGTVARFPQSALRDAFLANKSALEARADGKEPPEPHPLSLALMNASRPETWHPTFYDQFTDTGPVPDLSERQSDG